MYILQRHGAIENGVNRSATVNPCRKLRKSDQQNFPIFLLPNPSPFHFLFNIESGSGCVRTSYEKHQRSSFFLWDLL